MESSTFMAPSTQVSSALIKKRKSRLMIPVSWLAMATYVRLNGVLSYLSFFVVEFFFSYFFLFSFLTCCLLFFFLSVSSWPCKTFSWPCKTPFVVGVFYFPFHFGCYVRLFWWRTHPLFFSVPVHLTFSFLVYPSWAVPTLELVPAFLS